MYPGASTATGYLGTLNPKTDRTIHSQAIESFTGSWVPTASGPGPRPLLEYLPAWVKYDTTQQQPLEPISSSSNSSRAALRHAAACCLSMLAPNNNNNIIHTPSASQPAVRRSRRPFPGSMIPDETLASS